MIPVKSKSVFSRLISSQLLATMIAIAILAASISMLAETKVVKNELRNTEASILVDSWLARMAADSSLFAKIFFEIEAAALTFVSEPDGTLVANYSVDVLILDKDGEPIAEKIVTRTYLADDKEQADSNETQLSEIRIAAVSPHAQQALVQITDHNTGTEARLQTDLRLPTTLSSKFLVSGIQLSRQQEVLSGAAQGAPVTAVIPHPAAIYGIGNERLYYYVELYPRETMAADDSIHFQVSYLQPDHRFISVVAGVIAPTQPRWPVFSSLDTSELPPGEYRLIIETWTSRRERTTISERNFQVIQHPADIRFRPFEEILAELSLISEKSEVDQLKRVEEQNQQEALDRFWLERDPTPATDYNELRVEFYRRVAYAHHRFAQTSKIDGRITDQGKVFILYGSPDQVFRKNGNWRNSHVEIWQYQQVDLKAIFIDNAGFGNYHLLQPLTILD